MESPVGSAENVHGSITSVDKDADKDADITNLETEPSFHEEQDITLVEHLNLLRDDNPYRLYDERKHNIRLKIKERYREAPKTVLDEAEEAKPPIEKCLENTDKELADLLAFGREIITNVKVANEKRELLRRGFEANRRVELEEHINRETTEAMARYNDIVARWSELGQLKEPMVMFEKLEEQKERMAELMQSKDAMIAQCQREIERINERFEDDQRKQQTDISSLVERVDGQIEMLKKAYKHHLDLLTDTIDNERQTIALKEQSKWTEFYTTMQDSEQYKLDMAKEKKQFYANEIQRITAQQQEITRATRIRLEKDAEMLQFELRNTRNQVLMNSEKLDYNYQVLQKRNEENVIINNQQKRRVGKLAEAICEVKRRIQKTQTNADNAISRLTNDIQKLHDSISDLEKKSHSFRISNRKKFYSIWNINFDETKGLIEKVFDIDRILYENLLGIPWTKPEVDLREFHLIPKEYDRSPMASFQSERKLSHTTTSRKDKVDSNKKAEDERKRKEQRIELRLLRNILRKIADRGAFLVEDRLLKFLEPYSEEQSTVVRIDNIFTALRISNMEAVNRLVKFFKPYAWCPNCMDGLPPEKLKKLYAECPKMVVEEAESEESTDGRSLLPVTAGEAKEAVEEDSPKAEQPSQTVKEIRPCDNHYLIVESAMVLTALNEFQRQHSNNDDDLDQQLPDTRPSDAGKSLGGRDDNPRTNKKIIPAINIENDMICDYWRKFEDCFSKDKLKLWHAMEHGLQHYLEVLKQREKLDQECAFLRKQNAELKHLLQKFEV